MSPQRQRMIEAMILAGLSEGTQAAYLRAVWQLAKHYRRAPDQLSKEEVRAYLLDLRQRGVACGTFEIARAGLRFFFCQTLDRAWQLFGGKNLGRQNVLAPEWAFRRSIPGGADGQNINPRAAG